MPNSHSTSDNDADTSSLKGSSSDTDCDSNCSKRHIIGRIKGSNLLHIISNIEELINHQIGARPMCNSVLTGEAYAAELLSANSQEQRFQEVFRMSRRVFYKLCDKLAAGSYLRSIKNIAVNQQVAMFIWTVSHNRSSCEVQE